MKKRDNKILSNLAQVRLVSPAGLLVCAAVIVVMFAGLEALGLRSSVSVLTGPNSAAEGWPALGTACLYLLCYLGFIGLAPILLLGSIFLLLLNLIIGISCTKTKHS